MAKQPNEPTPPGPDHDNHPDEGNAEMPKSLRRDTAIRFPEAPPEHAVEIPQAAPAVPEESDAGNAAGEWASLDDDSAPTEPAAGDVAIAWPSDDEMGVAQPAEDNPFAALGGDTEDALSADMAHVVNASGGESFATMPPIHAAKLSAHDAGVPDHAHDQDEPPLAQPIEDDQPVDLAAVVEEVEEVEAEPVEEEIPMAAPVEPVEEVVDLMALVEEEPVATAEPVGAVEEEVSGLPAAAEEPVEEIVALGPEVAAEGEPEVVDLADEAIADVEQTGGWAEPAGVVEEEVSGLPTVGEEPVEEIVDLEPEVVDLADEAIVDVEQTGGSGVMDLGDDAVMSADTTEGPGIVDLGEGAAVVDLGDDAGMAVDTAEGAGVVDLGEDAVMAVDTAEGSGVVDLGDDVVMSIDTPEGSGVVDLGEDAVMAVDTTEGSGVVDLGEDAVMAVDTTEGSGVVDLGDDAVMAVDTTEGSGVVDLGDDALMATETAEGSGVVDLSEDALMATDTTEGSGVVDLGEDAVMAVDTVEGSGVVDLGEDAVMTVDTVEGSGVVDLGEDAVMAVDTTEGSGVVNLGEDAVMSAEGSGVVELGEDAFAVEDAAPASGGGSDVLNLGINEVVEEVPMPAGDSGVVDLGDEGVVEEDAHAAKVESDVIDLGMDEVIEEVPASADSGVVDLGEDMVVEDEMVAAGDSGVVDLGDDMVLDETELDQPALDGSGSAVALGQEPRAYEGGSASGRDFIAEAVESGVGLDLSGTDAVDAEPPMDMPLEMADLPDESSAVNLSDAPKTTEIPISSASSSGVSADAEEMDLEALLNSVGDSSASGNQRAAEEAANIPLEEVEVESDVIDLSAMGDRSGPESASGVHSEEEVDLEALLEAESAASKKSDQLAKKSGKKKPPVEPDLAEVDLGAIQPTGADDLPLETVEEEGIDLSSVEVDVESGAGSGVLATDEVIEEGGFETLDEPVEEVGFETLDEARHEEDREAAEAPEEEVEEEPVAAKGRKKAADDEEEEVEEEEIDKKPAKPRSRVMAWAGGTAIGALVGAGACAGALFLNVIPGDWLPKQQVPAPQITQPRPVEVDRTPPGDYLKYGELAKAEKADIMQKGTPLEKNQFVWDSYLQKQAKAKAPIVENAEPVKKVMAELGKSNTADALFQLGQIQEVAGNLDEAQKTYQKGADQFKDDKRFKAALTRVEVMRPEPAAAPPPKDKPEPEKQSRRALEPAERALWAMLLVGLQAPDQPKDKDKPKDQPKDKEPEEAGFDFWEAAKLARQQKFAEAIAKLDQARELHKQRRFVRLRKPQNPLSDPNEDIFLRSCDELKQFWLIQDKLQKGGYLAADKRDTGNAIDTLVKEAKDGAELRLARDKIVEKLTGAKVIDKPEDLDKGITSLLDERKAELDKKTKLAKTLADENVIEKIDKPEDLDKGLTTGIGKLLIERKAELDLKVNLAKKLSDGKIIEKVDKPEDLDKGLNTGVDKLLTDRKADAVKLETSLKETMEREQLLAKVQGELVNGKYLDEKADRTVLLRGLRDALKLAAMKDPMGELRDANTKLTALEDRRQREVAALNAQRKKEVGDITEQMNKEVDRLIDLRKKDVADIKDEMNRKVTGLQNQLNLRRPAAEMLPVWLPLLENGDLGQAARALADGSIVQDDPAAPPLAKVQGKVIQGLALRNLDQFAPARTPLTDALAGLPPGDRVWGAAAEQGMKDVANPPAYFLRKAEALKNRGDLAGAAKLLERGIKAVPEANGSLLADHSLVLLEIARGRALDGQVPAADPAVVQARKDADEAIKKAQGKDEDKKALAQAYYAQGRIFEETGLVGEAIGNYRAAVKAYPELDAIGSRYRVALARALVLPRQAQPQPPKEKAPAEIKMGQAPRLEDVLKMAGKPGQEEEARKLLAVLLTVALQPGLPVPPNRAEAVRLADEILNAPEGTVPFDVKAQAYAIKGLWTRALQTYAEGLKPHLRPEYYEGLLSIMRHHPQIRRPESLNPPNFFEAENRYGQGLRFYFARDYDEAEKHFQAATELFNQDARYFYFLGLAQLMQGKEEAAENFEQGARLEKDNLPGSREVSIALERVQGRARKVLNEARRSIR